ncbi:MAG: Ribosome-binding factor A [Firmicutes bacterium ADurb.BinA052]|nr:MAG: Ribosome-binding factor A [Firmicutes bacterium ADurb.BinA052]
MLASRRNDRVRAAMRQEISNMLQRDLKDPRLGFATVTDVRVSGDLQHVQVYVSILGDDVSRQQTMEALESARGYVRSEIGRRVQLRLTPEITFAYDDSIERGARLLRLISEVQSEEAAAQRDEETDN